MFSISDYFRRPQASRKYVDLIMEASSKWANWDPPKTIEAGDIGIIDKDSGQFEKIGSIYTHPATAEAAKAYPAVLKPAEDVLVINSVYAKKVGGGGGVNAGIPGAGNVKFETEIKFNKRRGAFLIMHNPRMTVVPDEFCSSATALGIPFFQDRKISVVTAAFACDGYALYLSSKQQESVKVALQANAPAPGAGAHAAGSWVMDGGSGVFRQAYLGNKAGYTPLYLLKSVQPRPPRRRETPDPNENDDDRWNEMEVPWDFLDSDGEEEPPEEFSDDE
ncbi:hypothetical protein PsYK624_059030 [Phanerochaete sordida]|uniref:Uncharacterized protein n=1 Tax=Phanerochaete sordida TaxID=48140 RepID=A0A9P3G8E8_9APHY|nr:hypothetical protein PsYK624_059030 [Phanerochaete sordida]